MPRRPLTGARGAAACVAVLLAAVAGHAQSPSGQVLGTLTVDAGAVDRTDTPIRYSIEAPALFGDPARFRRPGEQFYISRGADIALFRDHHLTLVETGGVGARLPVQWDPDIDFAWEHSAGRGALIWILAGTTPRQSTRSFDLVLEPGRPPAGPFAVEDVERTRLVVRQAGRPVLQYNYGMVHQTPGQTGPQDRTGYIHPVWTPAGQVITGDFSPEHLHQRGIYFAWARAVFGHTDSSRTHEANFWALGESSARVVWDDQGPSVLEGPVYAELAVHNQGRDQDKTWFREIWSIRIYALPGPDDWLFDIYLRQVPVDPDTPRVIPADIIITGATPRVQPDAGASIVMQLPQHTFGGLAFRGLGDWLAPRVPLEVLTSEGRTRADADSTGARWIDYTGPLGETWGGLAMFDHPANQRYPTPLRVHPSLPYFNYALTRGAPAVVHGNQPLELAYRVRVHDGRPERSENERLAADFADPPTIRWTRRGE